MPEWEDCWKIHEGCGGLIKWVEAINTSGVGYTGVCVHCGADRVVVEDIIPVEKHRVNTQAQPPQYSHQKLEDLSWDHDGKWENNQEYLARKINDVLTNGENC